MPTPEPTPTKKPATVACEFCDAAFTPTPASLVPVQGNVDGRAESVALCPSCRGGDGAQLTITAAPQPAVCSYVQQDGNAVTFIIDQAPHRDLKTNVVTFWKGGAPVASEHIGNILDADIRVTPLLQRGPQVQPRDSDRGLQELNEAFVKCLETLRQNAA